ncbi:MAG: peptidoglycan editing factor PgeF [Myxococcaceae bacterium]
MELLTVPTLRSRHGFPTRAGGRSQGAWASLNSSLVVGDDEAAVRANLSLLADAAGVTAAQLITVKQVHGDRVVDAADALATTEADALVTTSRGVAVGVRTADCLPILIEAPGAGAVAAVHAGWRGVIADIVWRAIERLEALGARRETLRLGIGPCIQRCCFEVDGDLPQRFEAAFGAEVVVREPGRQVRLDLVAAVRRSLERGGVPAAHVAALPHCTSCDARFFSHRRDHGITGRHLSFITCGSASDL